MREIKRLENKRFGRLKVLSFSHIKNGTYWLCKCDCGQQKVIRGSSLTSNFTLSCGCLQKEIVSTLHKTHGLGGNANRTPEYRTWCNIKNRCLNPNFAQRQDYLDRGIKVDDRWLGENGFTNFITDMGPRPSSEYSIDRINNDKGYEPNNCKWATKKEQLNNRARLEYFSDEEIINEYNRRFK